MQFLIKYTSCMKQRNTRDLLLSDWTAKTWSEFCPHNLSAGRPNLPLLFYQGKMADDARYETRVFG